MKEYNIKLLVHNDKAEFLFDCDKEKNTKCNKKNCNEYCNYTTDPRYVKARERQHNNNITDQEIIINLEKEIEYYRSKLQHIQEDMILANKPEDTIKFEMTKVYADNKLVQIIIDYKYKE